MFCFLYRTSELTFWLNPDSFERFCTYSVSLYKGWIKNNDNSSIFLTWLYSQGHIIHLPWLSRLPYLSVSFSNVRKALYLISASIFVHVPYWQPYRTDKFISSVVPGLSQWFFHFDEQIVIAWTHIGWVGLQWMFQNLPLPAELEVRDSSIGVTPCIIMKNDGVLYYQMSSHVSRSPWKHSCVLRHRATSTLIQSGRTIMSRVGFFLC